MFRLLFDEGGVSEQGVWVVEVVRIVVDFSAFAVQLATEVFDERSVFGARFPPLVGERDAAYETVATAMVVVLDGTLAAVSAG